MLFRSTAGNAHAVAHLLGTLAAVLAAAPVGLLAVLGFGLLGSAPVAVALQVAWLALVAAATVPGFRVLGHALDARREALHLIVGRA